MNHWINNPSELVFWPLDFPLEPSNWVERVLSYMEAFFKIAEEEQIWSLRRDVVGQEVFEAGKGLSYFDHMLQVMEKHEWLPLPGGGYGVHDPARHSSATLLCYHNPNGDVIQEYVEDTGRLLQHLRPEEVEFNEYYMLPTVPVYVYGQAVLKRDTVAKLAIELYTDIWFPWVRGFMGDDLHPEEFTTYYNPQRKMFDNRILANCHTVRLNRFLEKVRELTLSYEGNWLGVDRAAGIPDYVSQLGDVGIRLD